MLVDKKYVNGSIALQLQKIPASAIQRQQRKYVKVMQAEGAGRGNNRQNKTRDISCGVEPINAFRRLLSVNECVIISSMDVRPSGSSKRAYIT